MTYIKDMEQRIKEVEYWNKALKAKADDLVREIVSSNTVINALVKEVCYDKKDTVR